ncbi:MAG: hypothetical protein IIC39_00005 [Candidatus Marinimicrobia bacterium]|nr:hypothetical protein [Candidatus Neomarinimicrobiota bacterium]
MNFNSGHRFFFGVSGIGQGTPDPEAVLKMVPNSDFTTPWVYTIDVKFDKAFSISSFEVDLYLYVSNLFNRQNALNVYNSTGDPYDDGFLSDPELSGLIVEALGNTYVALYEAINLQNRQHWLFNNGLDADIFGPPRQIRFGMRFNF